MLLLFESYKGLSHPLSQFSFIFLEKLAGQRSSCIFTGENTEAQRGEVTCPKFWWTKGSWVIDPSASSSRISLILHELREPDPWCSICAISATHTLVFHDGLSNL